MHIRGFWGALDFLRPTFSLLFYSFSISLRVCALESSSCFFFFFVLHVHHQGSGLHSLLGWSGFDMGMSWVWDRVMR